MQIASVDGTKTSKGKKQERGKTPQKKGNTDHIDKTSGEIIFIF